MQKVSSRYPAVFCVVISLPVASMRGKGGEKKVRLKHVNLHITCGLCRGYLIDATTITECLHTFCKSCIVKYLDNHNSCPDCGLVIHQSYPKNYISHDRTMQDIVYKIVAELQQKEEKRERDFYDSRGILPPRAIANNEVEKEQPPTPKVEQDIDYHRKDEQVNICLECSGTQLKGLKKRYIRCSSQATVTHIKKFIALKIYHTPDRFKDVDVLCNEEILGKDHTLKFVVVTRWRFKDCPLLLHYRPRLEIS